MKNKARKCCSTIPGYLLTINAFIIPWMATAYFILCRAVGNPLGFLWNEGVGAAEGWIDLLIGIPLISSIILFRVGSRYYERTGKLLWTYVCLWGASAIWCISSVGSYLVSEKYMGLDREVLIAESLACLGASSVIILFIFNQKLMIIFGLHVER